MNVRNADRPSTCIITNKICITIFTTYLTGLQDISCTASKIISTVYIATVFRSINKVGLWILINCWTRGADDFSSSFVRVGCLCQARGDRYYKPESWENWRISAALQRQFRLYIPFLGIARPQPQFPHSCVFERFTYSQDQSTYFLQQNRKNRCGNI